MELLTKESKSKKGFDNKAHYVYAEKYPEAKVTEAIVNGLELTALCGKQWVPTREAENWPVCRTCKRIMLEMVYEV